MRCSSCVLSTAVSVALIALLSLSAPAQAAPLRPSHLYVQIGLGPAYVTNYSADHFYNSNDHEAPGMAVQLELGARMLRWLSLSVLQVVDVGAPKHEDYAPLCHFGFGLGVSFRAYGVQLMLGGGAQATSYMNYAENPSYAETSRLGPFGAASLGYVFPVGGRGMTLGGHAMGRYYQAKDYAYGTDYDPHGYALGALFSVGFEGKPIFGD